MTKMCYRDLWCTPVEIRQALVIWPTPFRKPQDATVNEYAINR